LTDLVRRRLARPATPPGLSVEAESRPDGRITIVLTSRDGKGAFRELDRPRLRPENVPLSRTGAGRYEAILPEPALREPIMVRVVVGENRPLFTRAIPCPLAPELASTGPYGAALEALDLSAAEASAPAAADGPDISWVLLVLAAVLVVAEAAASVLKRRHPVVSERA
jgi:hypothetical protein